MTFKIKLSWIIYITFFPITSACQQRATNTPVDFEKKSSPKKLSIKTIQKEARVDTPISSKELLPTKLHKVTHQGIKFNLVTFDSRKQSLIIADQTKGPGTIYPDAQTAAKSLNGIAAINAGFFTPEGKPLGLVISKGVKRGAYNTSSLGSGIYYQTDKGAHIKRRSVWTQLSKNPPAELLQSGPMLLEESKNIAGLSNKQSRVRSFIATDGNNYWCIGHASACTLNELSKALTTLKIGNFTPTTALNLDGGRSSDLWVSPKVDNGPLSIRPFWNKNVRNFLVLKHK